MWRWNLLRPEIQGIQRVLKLESENVHIISYVSSISTSHEKVYSIVRKVYGRSPTDELNDFDVNNTAWRRFMNVALQAAVHIGRDCMENPRITKNQVLKSGKQLS